MAVSPPRPSRTISTSCTVCSGSPSGTDGPSATPSRWSNGPARRGARTGVCASCSRSSSTRLSRLVAEDALGAVERPLYLTAAMTGLRQGELIALAWQDIDWMARRVRVADNFPRGRVGEPDSPKSHEGRSVPMADRLATELERHFQRTAFRGDTDLVFCHPETGRPLDPSKLGKRFKKSLARARARGITFHELRHTFGRRSRVRIPPPLCTKGPRLRRGLPFGSPGEVHRASMRRLRRWRRDQDRGGRILGVLRFRGPAPRVARRGARGLRRRGGRDS